MTATTLTPALKKKYLAGYKRDVRKLISQGRTDLIGNYRDEIIGDSGMQLFMPQVSGEIIPNRALKRKRKGR